MTLKEMVHQYKIKTGCSDSELARRCNVSRSTVARWSSGEIKKVNDDTAEILSHYLDIIFSYPKWEWTQPFAYQFLVTQKQDMTYLRRELSWRRRNDTKRKRKW